MSFTSIGSLGGAGNEKPGADTSFVLTTVNTLEAGNLGVLWVALDNFASGADGDENLISGVVDSAGNTWEKLGAFSNTQGAAAAGACIELWAVIATSQLTGGGTITGTLNNGVDAKAYSAWEFDITETDFQIAGTIQTNAFDGSSDPAGQTLSGLTSKEYLFLHALAMERTLLTMTKDADYTAIDTSATAGGAAATNMGVYGEFRIFTGTGDTADVSFSGTADGAQIFLALEEVAGAAGQPFAQRHIGIPTARRDRPGGWN
jgi:hypothetical protein